MTRAGIISSKTAPEARADALVAAFERAGYARVTPAILQPAEPFLDLSGEDIRKRMYLASDPQGRELCLRPDLTIPVSRDYLASPEAGAPRGFCYLGPVFRHRGEGETRSEEHTSELQSRQYLVCRLLLEKKRQLTNRCQVRA